MTSFRLSGIPGDLLRTYSHKEISHCSSVKKAQRVLKLGSNNLLSLEDQTSSKSEKFDLAVVNLSVMPSSIDSLNRLVKDLKPSGYFGLLFFHWPSMRNWFIYELQSNLLKRDQQIWEKSCRQLNEFLDEGTIQVVEREVIQISPKFLENIDLIALFEEHCSSFNDCFDELVLVKIKNTLLNLEDFLGHSNSNLDLYIESVFGVREW